MYFISPFVFYYIKNNFCFRKATITFLFIIILLCLTTFLSHYVHSSIQTLYQMSTRWTIYRFPAFMTGMLIACYGSSFHTKPVLGFITSFLCLTLAVLSRLYHIPNIPIIPQFYSFIGFLFIIPPVVVFCAHLDIILQHTPQLIKKILFWMGTSSLELYVVHEALYSIIFKGMKGTCNHWILLSFAIIASILSAYLLKLCASSIQRQFSPLR